MYLPNIFLVCVCHIFNFTKFCLKNRFSDGCVILQITNEDEFLMRKTFRIHNINRGFGFWSINQRINPDLDSDCHYQFEYYIICRLFENKIGMMDVYTVHIKISFFIYILGRVSSPSGSCQKSPNQKLFSFQIKILNYLPIICR